MSEEKCPKCKKVVIEVSRYSRWGKDDDGNPIPAALYIHKKEPMNIGGFQVAWKITESCLVKG